MKDQNEKVKKEINTECEKVVEIEFGEFNINTHSTFRALSKFCDLYIGVEENFLVMRLQDAMIKNQKQFRRLHEKIYKEAFGKPMPKVPEQLNLDELPEDERKALIKKQEKFGKEFADLTTKKVEIKYLSIEISKNALERAMERETKKTNGVTITPNDLNILRRFIDFV